MVGDDLEGVSMLSSIFIPACGNSVVYKEVVIVLFEVNVRFQVDVVLGWTGKRLTGTFFLFSRLSAGKILVGGFIGDEFPCTLWRKDFHVIDFDLERPSLHAILPRVLALPDTSLQVHLGTLVQVLVANFGEFSPGHTSMPFGVFLFLTAFVLSPSLGGCDREVYNGDSVRCVADFRLLPQVSDQYYFVDSHRCLLILKLNLLPEGVGELYHRERPGHSGSTIKRTLGRGKKLTSKARIFNNFSPSTDSLQSI